MATENPNLPAPEERVSDAAEDVQTVTSEVTSEVPETEASAAAEAEPVVETPAAEEPETEKSVAGTPAAEVPVAEAPAAEEPVAEPEAAPRAKRARIKPVAEAVETESGEEAVPAGAEVDFADEEAALAAQDAGLELEQALKNSLRSGDLYTRYSTNQYLILLIGIEEENCGLVIERINDNMERTAGKKYVKYHKVLVNGTDE